jgi:hypothetical protein
MYIQTIIEYNEYVTTNLYERQIKLWMHDKIHKSMTI